MNENVTTAKGESNDVESIHTDIKKLSFWIGGSAFFCALITIIIYILAFHESFSRDHAEWGQFGDFFGGTLNPVFGLLSLLAILIALLFQAKELSHSTVALNKQADYLRLQAFESTFFSMVTMHNENLKGLDLDETEKERYYGRSIFRIIHRRLKDSYTNCDDTDEMRKIKDAYGKFYKKNHRFIGHYLQTLNQIFTFIMLGDVSNLEKYWKFIKAQLNEYELAIIFYHALTREDFVSIDILKKNDIFQDFEYETLINIESHTHFLRGGE